MFSGCLRQQTFDGMVPTSDRIIARSRRPHARKDMALALGIDNT